MHSKTSLFIDNQTIGFGNLVEVIQYHVQHHPDREALIFLGNGEDESGRLTYRQLDQKARAIAAYFTTSASATTSSGNSHQHPQQHPPRALLAFQNGLEFISAFYGCLYAGVCAVPVFPPQNRDSYLERLESIASDCQATYVLGMSDYLELVEDKFAAYPTLSATKRVAADQCEPPDELKNSSDGSNENSIENNVITGLSAPSHSLAFFQYTSGSTSLPKGVMVSHGNLLHNISVMQRRWEHDHTDTIVSWLPMFHDMGLIGVVLQALCIGARCVAMTPAAFLQKPMRWLEAMSKYGGTSTFAPNFAYDLCALRAKPEDIERLDLSPWQMALNGAEPIRAQTLEDFCSVFAPCGFRAEAMYPAYGLAEATLYISGSEPLTGVYRLPVDAKRYEQENRVHVLPEGDPNSRILVSSGIPAPEHTVVIVDPDHHTLCEEGEVGEIWIHSDSVAGGYWDNSDATHTVFAAQVKSRKGDRNQAQQNKHFMRTGDLGFLWQQQLFISSRIKDVLIIRGANYYPQDIEETVQRHVEGFKDNAGAAFTVGEGDQQKLVLVQEIERTWMKKLDRAAAFVQAKQIVSETLGLSLDDIVIIKPAAIPKTSSGKIQRSKACLEYQSNDLKVVARYLDNQDLDNQDLNSAPTPKKAQKPAGKSEQKSEQNLEQKPAQKTAPANEAQLLNQVLRLLVANATASASNSEHINDDQPLSAYGLDSLQMAELSEHMHWVFGVSISLEHLLAGATISELSSSIVTARKATKNQSTVQVTDSTKQPNQPNPSKAPQNDQLNAPDTFALSLNQQQLMLIHEKAPNASAYNVALCLQGQFEPKATELALRKIVALHPVLHSLIERAEANSQDQFQAPFQEHWQSNWQHRVTALPSSLLQITQATEEDTSNDKSSDQLRERIVAAAKQPFNLYRELPCRFVLFRATQSTNSPNVANSQNAQENPPSSLLLSFHHIAVDMLSVLNFVQQFLQAYQQPQLALESAVNSASYAQFVAQQQQFLASSAAQQSQAYWQSLLQQDIPVLNLPIDKRREPQQSFAGDSIDFAFTPDISQGLRQLATTAGVTLNSTLLSLYQVFLAKLCYQQRFAIGVLHANRSSDNNAHSYKQSVGYFVEPAVFVAEQDTASTAQTVPELLQHTQRQITQMLAQRGGALAALLQHRSQGSTSDGIPPVFQTLFNFYPQLPLGLTPFNAAGESREIGAFSEFKVLPLPAMGAQLDLSLLVADDGEQLQLRFEYNSQLFEAQTVRNFAAYLSNLASQFSGASSLDAIQNTTPLKVADTGLLASHAFNETSNAFNEKSIREQAQTFAQTFTLARPASTYPTVSSAEYAVPIHTRIFQQIDATPTAEALRFNGQSLSYAELGERVNALAAQLIAQCPAESVIGVCAERSFDMVIALLATLRAGCAYVPLDPAMPSERLGYCLQTAKVAALLCQPALRELSVNLRSNLKESIPVVSIEADVSGASETHRNVSEHSTAYVMFTSGSTGKPKGVMNSHRGISNRLNWMQRAYNFNANTRTLQKTPYTFDVSVWELFLPLMSGGTLVIAKPGGHQEADYLQQIIRDERITAMHFVPAMLDVFLERLEHAAVTDSVVLPSLKQVFCSGEALSKKSVNRCFQALPNIELHNLYGPTEAAIDVTHWQCFPDDQRHNVPIGYSIDNIALYVLDRDQQPVPPGILGELYIAGVGVAQGYINNSALTEQAFVPNPFVSNQTNTQPSPNDYQRLYRTGDLVRFDADGLLHYVGRTDSQIKLRGLRIELGDIDTALTQLTKVAEAATIVLGQGAEAKLASFVVLKDKTLAEKTVSDKTGTEETVSEEKELANALKSALQTALQSALPGYMIPDELTLLSSMPVNANGKIDRKALADLAEQSRAVELSGLAAQALPGSSNAPTNAVTDQQPPANPQEQRVAAQFANVLQLPATAIHRHSHFFNSGGNSLLASRLAIRLSHVESLGVNHSGVKSASNNQAQLTVRDVFEQPEVWQLAQRLAEIQGAQIAFETESAFETKNAFETETAFETKSGEPESTETIHEPSQEKSNSFALSANQRSLWFYHRLQGASATYHIPLLLNIVGAINIDTLQRSVQQVLASHDVLNHCYRDAYSASDSDEYLESHSESYSGGALGGVLEGEPRQFLIDGSPDTPVQVFDLNDAGEVSSAQNSSQNPAQNDKHTRQQALVSEFIETPFDLSQERPVRVGLVLNSVQVQQDSQQACSLQKGTQQQDTQHKPSALFMLCVHHIAADGIALARLVDDLIRVYALFHSGYTANLNRDGDQDNLQSSQQWQYQDYVTWQANWLQSDAAQRAADYWHETLAELPPLLPLPTDYPRPAKQRFVGECLPLSVDNSLTAALRETAATQNVSLYSLILTAFATLLYRYMNVNGEASDFAIGVPFSGRTTLETEQTVGYFANTLPVRCRIADIGDKKSEENSNSISLQSLLQQIHNQCLQAQEHQRLPLDVLVNQLCPERSASHSPLFQVLCSLEQTPDYQRKFAPLNWNVSPQWYQHRIAKFDLSLMLHESPGRDSQNSLEPARQELEPASQELASKELDLSGYLEFNTDLFHRSTIAAMAEQLLAILHAMVQPQQLAQPLHRLDFAVATNAGEPQLSNELKTEHETDLDTALEKELEIGLYARFAQQALNTPDNVALIHEANREKANKNENSQLTYQQLHQQVQALAHQLQQQGVTPGSAVGVMMQPSNQRIAALLAVLACGGYYVPLDSQQPISALENIGNQVQMAHVLCDANGVESKVDSHNINAQAHSQLQHIAQIAQVIPVQPLIGKEQVGKQQIAASESFVAANTHGSDLAYVLFTSGSTGQAKGVLVPQRAVLRLVTHSNFMELGDNTRFMHGAPLAFDASTLEIWAPLCNGGTVVTYPSRVPIAHELQAFIARHQVNAAWLTSSLFNQLIDDNTHCVAGLSQLLVGGDVVSAQHVRKAHAANTALQIINGYGPTETTTFAACFPLSQAWLDSAATSVPIGYPLQYTQIKVLNGNQQPVPSGAVGELYVGGAGLAQGYLNLPDATAQAFMLLPESTGEPSRYYRTGDLVRQDTRGCLHYVGRKDHQVKIRGFRIELAGIDAAIQAFPGVSRSITRVVSDDSGTAQQKQLVSWVVFSADEQSEPTSQRDQLWAHLKQTLPSYSVPSFIQTLDAMPLTANGKLNVNALPPVSLSDISAADYQPPQTDNERVLVALWAQLFNIPQHSVSRNAHFFQLGGHSLLATRLTTLLAAEHGYELPLSAVFDQPQLAQLALCLQPKNSLQVEDSLAQSSRTQVAGNPNQQHTGELSFSQSRLWFLTQLQGASSVYHIPAVLDFRGSEDAPVNTAALTAALHNIVARHDVLRTCYHEHVHTEGDSDLSTQDQSAQDLSSQELSSQEQNTNASTQILEASAFKVETLPLPTFSEPEKPDLATIDIETQPELVHAINQFCEQPFDISRDLPIRAALMPLSSKAEKTRQLLVLCVHHIAFDGWSLDLLLAELKQAYCALAREGLSNTENNKTESQNSASNALNQVFANQPKRQFQQFSTWQRAQLSPARLATLGEYWQQQLQGATPLLELPGDFPRPPVISHRGECLKVTLPAELVGQISAMSAERSLSLFMSLLSGFNLLVAKLSGDEGSDICVGTPVANRTHEDFMDTIGFFANTLVLRSQIDWQQSLPEYLQSVKHTVLQAQAHQDMPFELLVEHLQPQRSLAYSPLFQVMFSLRHGQEGVATTDTSTNQSWNDLQVSRLKLAHSVAKFDLSFMLEEQHGQVSGFVEFNTDLFRRETIERFWSSYVYLLQQMVDCLSANAIEVRKLQDLALVNASNMQNEHVAALVGDTLAYPSHGIHHGLHIQAAKTPHAIALQCGDQQMDYRGLSHAVNQLAHALQDSTSAEEERTLTGKAVAVYLHRTPHLLVSLLAVMQAGGFYVPLDPAYPEARIRQILDSSQPALILSESSLAQAFDNANSNSNSNTSLAKELPHLFVDELFANETKADEIPSPDAKHVNNPHFNNPHFSNQSTAYAIYTSGSTGQPKGIAISHRNAMAMLSWAASEYQPEQLANVLAATSVCFDLSVFELFLPLQVGGTVTLADDLLALIDDSDQSNYQRNHKGKYQSLTLINTVPSAMEAVLDADALPASVSTVNLAGEPLSRALTDRLYAQANVRKVYNLYGPSEDTTYSTFSLVPEQSQAKPLIGKPIANTQAYVLDAGNNLLPIGVPGELYLAGDGVATGYLGQPQLTASAFLNNSFAGRESISNQATQLNNRLYKTGDKVRLLSNGELEYLGRLDNQVKLRGFRIELGEIESVAQRHTQVKEAIAVLCQLNSANSDSPVSNTANSIDTRQLVLFVTLKHASANQSAENQNSEDQNSEISALLAQQLPDYMQPKRVIVLGDLPHLPNGKVDRKALSAQALSALTALSESPNESDPANVSLTPDQQPESEIEKTLANIWTQLLGSEQHSRQHNFFERGGHSLLATQLVSRIKRTFAITLTVRDVFQRPHLHEQAALIEVLVASAAMQHQQLASPDQSTAQNQSSSLDSAQTNSPENDSSGTGTPMEVGTL